MRCRRTRKVAGKIEGLWGAAIQGRDRDRRIRRKYLAIDGAIDKLDELHRTVGVGKQLRDSVVVKKRISTTGESETGEAKRQRDSQSVQHVCLLLWFSWVID